MNTIQKVARNIVVLFAGNIISKFLYFLCVMFIARYLGTEGFGVLSFVLAFTGIFGIIADLGLEPLVTREVTRDRSLASKYITNITTMKVILVSITFGLISLTINLLGYPKGTRSKSFI